MKSDELREFLFDQIPIACALQVSVLKCDSTSAELSAPLEPNRNHLGTAFGGSLGAILILAGYTWLYNAMESRNLKCHVLLKKSEVEYFHPVTAEFHAVAHAPNEKEFEKFLDTFRKKGTARIVITASITNSNETACRLVGEFVAKRSAVSNLG